MSDLKFTPLPQDFTVYENIRKETRNIEWFRSLIQNPVLYLMMGGADTEVERKIASEVVERVLPEFFLYDNFEVMTAPATLVKTKENTLLPVVAGSHTIGTVDTLDKVDFICETIRQFGLRQLHSKDVFALYVPIVLKPLYSPDIKKLVLHSITMRFGSISSYEKNILQD